MSGRVVDTNTRPSTKVERMDLQRGDKREERERGERREAANSSTTDSDRAFTDQTRA
jgi:hypothetical protein